MTSATSNLWALIVNDPTNPAVRALCEAVSGMLDVAEVGASLDAGLFAGGARGLAVGQAWPRIGPALLAAAERLGWRPLVGGTVAPDSIRDCIFGLDSRTRLKLGHTSTDNPTMANKIPLLLNVPALAIDKELAPIPPHGYVERRIVWNVFHALALAGYVPSRIDTGDGENIVYGTLDAMELIFNLNEARVYFKHPIEKCQPWLLLIGGNKVDVVSDYSALPLTFVSAIESIDPEALQ